MITISQIVYRGMPNSTIMGAQELRVILENCPGIDVLVRLTQSEMLFKLDREEVIPYLVLRENTSLLVNKYCGAVIFEEIS